MKKKVTSFLSALLFAALLSQYSYAAPDNSSYAAVLMHADTGAVLFEQSADDPMLIASTVKIMTALVVLDNCDLDERVEIKAEYTNIEGSSMYLEEGQTYTVSDLLYGMMLASGNDAATALAFYAGGSLEKFADMMNKKADKLDLKNTRFENPHGLDAENQFSSARDLAIITAAAMENETFCKIVSTRSYTVNDLTYTNHNKLLWQYDGAIGVKTGYTIAAGRILVSCAERQGMRLICVTIKDPDDWRDHVALFDWAFDNYCYKCVLKTGEFCNLPVISGTVASIGVAPNENLWVLMKKGTDFSLSVELPRFVFADIATDEKIGKVSVIVDGKTVCSTGLHVAQSVSIDESIRLTPFERLKRSLSFVLRYGPFSYGYY